MESKHQQKNIGGMFGASITRGGGPSGALAGPVGPNVTACKGNCCPPNIDLSMIHDFKFEDYRSPVTRVRRPAHNLDSDSIKDFKEATSIMKSLPSSDPRSFLQQANVHGAYCCGAYPVVGHPDQQLQVHGNWLFASFHRWYLYFLERIMGKLIQKPGFALPYWNWDHPEGMRIPEIFKDLDSPLYNPNRDASHINEVIDLSYGKEDNSCPYQEQIKQNLLLMHKQMCPTDPLCFFGAPYPSGCKDHKVPYIPGALELSPHNNVHNWTGDPHVGCGQDMGVFSTAARDPIFYCHHANVDRLWTIWRNDLPGGPREDLDDPGYLNSYFIFFDEDIRPVKVYVKDSFDTKKLGYVYEDQELPWLFQNVPKPVPAKPKTSPTEVKFPKRLDSVITTKVVRPPKKSSMARGEKEDDRKEEVLSIKLELEEMTTKFTKFDVYVNDYSDHEINEKTQIKPEFAGSFTKVPMEVGGAPGGSKMGGSGKPMKGELRLSITMLLEEIGASDDAYIQVTIVPISATENIVISDDIKIDFVA